MVAPLFCSVLQLRIHKITHNILSACNKCGYFKHVLYMDDTTYLHENVVNIQTLLHKLHENAHAHCDHQIGRSSCPEIGHSGAVL